MKRALATMLIAGVGLAPAAGAWAQKSEGLALTPQMGWNSWNKFACNIDEKLIRETADAMVKIGLKDAGYQYINIDDCWHGARDADGNMHPDPQRFPSGMKALSDYVHARGLKLASIRTWVTPPAATVRAAAATNTRMRAPTPPGASTTSSMTGATARD
jgi:alpha-galactosidase